MAMRMAMTIAGWGEHFQSQFLQQIDQKEAATNEELWKWIAEIPLRFLHKSFIVFTVKYSQLNISSHC